MATNPVWFQGVGIPSFNQMDKVVNAQFPNTFNNGHGLELSYDGGGYHATGNAVDYSNSPGNSGSPQEDTLAAWIAANYGPYTLELIHVNMDGSTVTWKNGQNVDVYDATTLAQHHNHVHWAITNNGLAAAGQPTNVVTGGSSNAVLASSSSNPVSKALGGVLSGILAPIFEFLVTSGMVTAGGTLLLFGAYLVVSS